MYLISQSSIILFKMIKNEAKSDLEKLLRVHNFILHFVSIKNNTLYYKYNIYYEIKDHKFVEDG
jgi:hypothetical protein